MGGREGGGVWRGLRGFPYNLGRRVRCGFGGDAGDVLGVIGLLAV